MCSEDMPPSFMCFLALCFIPVESFIIPLMWSEDIWSLDIPSGFGVVSCASATLPKPVEHRAKPSAAATIFGLDAMKRNLPRCRRVLVARPGIDAPIVARRGPHFDRPTGARVRRQTADISTPSSSLRNSGRRARLLHRDFKESRPRLSLLARAGNYDIGLCSARASQRNKIRQGLTASPCEYRAAAGCLDENGSAKVGIVGGDVETLGLPVTTTQSNELAHYVSVCNVFPSFSPRRTCASSMRGS